MTLNHQYVDTSVITSRRWSGSDGLPETAFQNNLNLSLAFRLLATDSAGMFTLTVSVRPKNSAFIIESNGTANYNLTVKRKLCIVINVTSS